MIDRIYKVPHFYLHGAGKQRIQVLTPALQQISNMMLIRSLILFRQHPDFAELLGPEFHLLYFTRREEAINWTSYLKRNTANYPENSNVLQNRKTVLAKNKQENLEENLIRFFCVPHSYSSCSESAVHVNSSLLCAWFQ